LRGRRERRELLAGRGKLDAPEGIRRRGEIVPFGPIVSKPTPPRVSPLGRPGPVGRVSPLGEPGPPPERVPAEVVEGAIPPAAPPEAFELPEELDIPTREELEEEFEDLGRAEEQREEESLLERRLEAQLARTESEQEKQIARETERVRRQGESAGALLGSVGGFGFVGNTQLVAGIQNEGAKFLEDLRDSGALQLNELLLNQEVLRSSLKKDQRQEFAHILEPSIPVIVPLIVGISRRF